MPKRKPEIKVRKTGSERCHGKEGRKWERGKKRWEERLLCKTHMNPKCRRRK
jgi:hypothetical protein